MRTRMPMRRVTGRTRPGIASGIAPTPTVSVVPQVYRFDGNLTDAAAGGKDLTGISGLATYLNPGMFGSCLGDPANPSLDVTVGRAQDLLTGALETASYSVSFWTKSGNSTGELLDIKFIDASAVVQFRVKCAYRASGADSAQVGFNNNTPITSVNKTFGSGWHHIAVSVSAGTASLWIDAATSVTVATLAVPSGLTFDPTGTFRVVCTADIAIDDLGIKQAALTLADVQAIYAIGVGSLYPTT